MIVTGYVRNNGNKFVLEGRLEALNRAGCDDIIIEEAFGIEEPLPLLDRYLKTVNQGDQLVVCDIQSLSRNYRVVVETVDALKKRKAKFRMLQDNLDPSTPEGKLTIRIRAAQCEYIASLSDEEAQRQACSDITEEELASRALDYLEKGRH